MSNELTRFFDLQLSQWPETQQRYRDLQQTLYSFIQERKWCQYNLKTNERIECALQINLTEASGDVMKGTMTIVLQRPVYKTSYKTTLMNFQDKKIQSLEKQVARLKAAADKPKKA